MASKYYDSLGKEVYDGDIVYASDLNDINSAVDSGFQQVESDITSVGSDAESWANKASQWAEEPEDSQVEPGQYSALHWAAKAEASAQIATPDDTPYGPSWDTDQLAATKNVLYDKFESLTKTDVGLDNVDNTTDLNKPVSTATQSAIDQLSSDTSASLLLKSDISTTVTKDSSTGAASIPTGTTAQRPTGATGLFRFNSTENRFEGYDGSSWSGIGGSSVNIGYDVPDTSGSVNLDCLTYDTFTISPLSAMTLSFSGWAEFKMVKFVLTGAENITWPGTVQWQTLPAVGSCSVVGIKAGSTYYLSSTSNTSVGIIQSKPLMHVQDQKPSGTDGGSSTSGWNTRDINTVLTNDISGASLAANTITLPAGEYYIEATAPWYGTSNRAMLTVQDGASNVLVSGGSGISISGNSNWHSAMGRVSLATTTNITVEQYQSVTTATNGLGIKATSGGNEVYTDLRIWQLDAEKETPRIYQPVNQLVPGVMPTGLVDGGTLSWVNANTVSVGPYSATADDLNTPLFNSSSTILTTASDFTAINTVYNIFACKLNDDSQVIRVDTDEFGANVGADVVAKVWLGFVLTEATGSVSYFSMAGDEYSFEKYSESIFLTGLTTTPTALDLSSVCPVSRIQSFDFGSRSSGTGWTLVKNSGGFTIGAIQTTAGTDTDYTSWGYPIGSPMIVYRAGLELVATAATISQALRRVKLIR